MPIGNPGRQKWGKNFKHPYAELVKQRLIAHKGIYLRTQFDESVMLDNEEYQRYQLDIIEVQRIDMILELLKDDAYYVVIDNIAHGSLTDEALALKLHCDTSTIRRHKLRLLKQLALTLYGIEAIEYDEERTKINYEKTHKA